MNKCTSLKYIGDRAFVKARLCDKVLDFSGMKSLTYIGAYAFESAEIANIKLSGCVSLKEIGERAFVCACLEPDGNPQ